MSAITLPRASSRDWKSNAASADSVSPLVYPVRGVDVEVVGAEGVDQVRFHVGAAFANAAVSASASGEVAVPGGSAWGDPAVSGLRCAPVNLQLPRYVSCRNATEVMAVRISGTRHPAAAQRGWRLADRIDRRSK